MTDRSASEKLAQVRAWFPHTRHLAYLNHASTSPLSIRVKAALDAFIHERHETKVENFFDFLPVLDQTRTKIARLLHTTPDRVAFSANASYALNVLALGLDWQPGDRIAIPGCEFPANVHPFLNLRRLGVEVDFVPHREGCFSLEDVEKTLTPRTRLLSVSWVQFLSGFRCDLAALGALCRAKNIVFCVDAIQGLGALQWPDAPESLGVDFVATSNHKWLMASQGLGFLYCSETLQEKLTPALVGWLSGTVDWDNFFDYRLDLHDDATRFHLGTLNHLGIAALNAALTQYEDAGPAWCEQQVLANAHRLASQLDACGFARYGPAAEARASGIVTIKHPEPEQAHERLQQRQVHAALRNRLLRFSPTWYNSEEEIERAVEALMVRSPES